MEDLQQGSQAAEDRSNKTAEALRALREGLGSKIETHRRRISDLETDLTARVLQIAEELAQEQAAESQAELSLHEEQLRKLRESLSERDSKIAQLELRIADAEAHRELIAEELANSRSAIDAVRVAECQDCAQLRTELTAVNDRQANSTARVEELLAQIGQLTQELTESRETEARLLTQHRADDSALAESQVAVAEARQLLDGKVGELAAERDALVGQVSQLQAELSLQAETLSSEHSWLEKELQAGEQSRKQLVGEFEDLLKKYKGTETELEAAKLKNDQAVALLKRAEEKILEITHSKVHEEELEQARRKFELALADAQKLKRENAELQEELAHRPEVSEQETPKLVSLRVERDALAARVAELESAPVHEVDEDAERDMSDLQRRFELAVEDLRHLKQENAQLKDKLASVPQATSIIPSLSHPAMDWQSQKARLLALLESEEAAEQTPERQQERTTIEGTISITDHVVAEKDRLIAELQAQLADESIAVSGKENVEGEILDKDELIQAERSKLDLLQKEWREKLRTAEMEMSLQRATLARKESELQQKLQAVEQAQAEAPAGPDGKPRRKWLSALGLRDDDEK